MSNDGVLTEDLQEFFRFFDIKAPPGTGLDSARRFMHAYLRDPERQARWRQHLEIRPQAAAAMPATRIAPTISRPAAPTAPPRQATGVEAFEFTGSGGEYFRIWIVNLLLTILTLGIYSAWAKVRRMQYFYRHTRLAGSVFDFHGSPVAILKGRLIAAGLLIAYNFSFQISAITGFATLVLLAIALPWLLRNSFRFRLHNSSYRGLRFRFGGSVGESYRTFLLRPLLVLLTLYLAAPWFHQRLKRYQHGQSFFGQSPFSFDATVGQFYRAYLLVSLGMIAVFGAGLAMIVAATQAAIAAQQGGAPPDPQAAMAAVFAATAVMMLGMLFLTPLWQARIQNVVWSHTALGPHRFRSEISALKLFGIHLTNFIGVVLTLGFFMPWAAVRIARYRLETVTLLPQGNLDDFIVGQQQAEAAVGEETAELFDIDIGL